MSDKSWKAFERRLALVFPHAQRRGAYTGNGRKGRPDLICRGWSVECKLLARAGYQDLLDAARQAEDNREGQADIPVAVVKRKGDLDKNALVVMRLETFREFFVNQGERSNDESDEGFPGGGGAGGGGAPVGAPAGAQVPGAPGPGAGGGARDDGVRGGGDYHRRADGADD